MLNHICIMGRLTRDPEVRMVGEVSVCNFRIACDRDYKNQSGERETDFIDVVAWRGLADTVVKYFSKGRMAVIDGRLQIRNWTDDKNVKHYAAEIVADHVYFGDSKPQDTQNGSAPAGAYGQGGSGYARGGQNAGYGGNGGYGNAPSYGSASGYGNAGGYGGGSNYGNPPENFVPDFGGSFPS